MTNLSLPDLIRLTAAQALAAAAQLVPEWLPEGQRKGREWVARNTLRGDRQAGSFGVSLDSGRWNDFADSSVHGGDLVSLLAYLSGCRQLEAAQAIDRRLGLGLFAQDRRPATRPTLRQPMAEDAGEARQTASEKLRARQEAVAHQAARLWQMGKPAERLHPYLKAKALKPLHLRQLSRGRLLVPLCRDGRLANLQVIDARGDKRFLPGPVAGTYSPIGTLANNPRLYICEGWATGATLHQQTGCPVVCALSANNLKAVAVAMRTRYGDLLELVVAGDDDRQTLGNPGRCAADRAADAAGALVLFPQWPDDAPAHLSDFNDLHLWHAQKDGQS